MAPRSGVPRRMGLLQACKVIGPQFVPVPAQVVEIVPGIDAGVVAVGEAWLHSVIADRFESADLDAALAGLQHFLPRPMPAYFGGGRMHSQELESQFVAGAVREGQLEPP